MLSFDQLPSAVSELLSRLTAIEKLLAGHSPADAPEKEFLTVEETAALLNLTVATMYGKVHRREIPHSKSGKNLIFRRSEIESWIAANRKPTTTESRRDARRRI